MVGFNREKIIVQHYNQGWNSKNDGKLMKLYDFNFLVKLNFLDILNHTFGWSSVKVTSIYDYKNAKIDIYGAARNGSTWKGSRVIWEDN